MIKVRVTYQHELITQNTVVFARECNSISFENIESGSTPMLADIIPLNYGTERHYINHEANEVIAGTTWCYFPRWQWSMLLCVRISRL